MERFFFIIQAMNNGCHDEIFLGVEKFFCLVLENYNKTGLELTIMIETSW